MLNLVYETYLRHVRAKSLHIPSAKPEVFFFFPSIFSWIDIIVYRKIRQIFHLIPFLHEKPVKSGHQGTIYSGKKEEESEMC